MRGYLSTNSATSPLGTESADNLYLLAKKMTLERQRSLPTAYPYWGGRDATSSVPMSDIIQDSPSPHSRLLSSIADSSRPVQPSQNVDLLSILHGIPERTTTGANNGVGGWSNFPVQGGLDPLQDKLDMHHPQTYQPQPAFGVQQQRLQPQNSPPLPNMLSQVMDNPSSMFSAEKLLSSSLSQDPQLLSLLQQQYLLQLHSQGQPSSQQVSLLEKFLLLKQQQKQEEQQLLLRQQQLLSQVISDNRPQQRFAESSYGQLPASGMSGNSPVDHPLFQPSQNLFPIGSQIQTTNLQDERVSNLVLPQGVSQDIPQTVDAEVSAVGLPHRFFNNTDQQRIWDHSLSEHLGAVEQKSSSMAAAMTDPLGQLEMTNRYPVEQLMQSNEPVRDTTSKIASSFKGHLENSILPAPQASGSNNNESVTAEEVQQFEMPSAGGVLEPQGEGEQLNDESSLVKEVKNVEARDVKKSSDKKSRKQKSSKGQSSDIAKGVAKLQDSRPSEVEGTNAISAKSDRHSLPENLLVASAQEREHTSDKVNAGVLDTRGAQNLASTFVALDDGQNAKDESGQVGSALQSDSTQALAGQRAWKHAPGFKPKSLLEIQQEEQRRAQEVTPDIFVSLSSLPVSTPWAGVVANSDVKSLREMKHDTSNSDLNVGRSENSLNQKNNVGKLDSSLNQRNKKSQLHDLLEDNPASKSSEREMGIQEGISSFNQVDSVSDNFIDAKDTKKSRKKSKSKNASTKASAPVTTSDAAVASSPIEKTKSSRMVQPEKDVLPAIPSGPSLGDFVVWKGESANSSPAPAWSTTDSGKIPKPTSLRDILKEQEKKGSSVQIPVPAPQKSAPSQSQKGGGSSWSVSASSPAKAASPIQINSQVSFSKHKGDDDLFWGPLDQPKQESKLYDTPPYSCFALNLWRTNSISFSLQFLCTLCCATTMLMNAESHCR